MKTHTHGAPPLELLQNEGRAVRLGSDWVETHRVCVRPTPLPLAWQPALEKRIDSIIAAEGQTKIYNRGSTKVDMGHEATLYKTKGADFFILGYQAAAREGRVELTKTNAFLLLGNQAYAHPLNPTQQQHLARIEAATADLPPNFFAPGAYSKSRGEFIERMRAGYVLRNVDWLPTFKVAPASLFTDVAMPARVRETLELVLADERQNPTVNGSTREVVTEGGKIRWAKWLDTKTTPRDGILDIRVDQPNLPAGRQMDRMEITLRKGYTLASLAPTSFNLPAEMTASLQDIFARSPNPFTQGKTSFEPASGEVEARLKGANRIIVGVDESGRGNWAGPMTAAAVAYDAENPHPLFKELRDSKSYKPDELRDAFSRIMSAKIPFGIGIVSGEEVNKLHLDDANRLAFVRALDDLKANSPGLKVDYIVLDGLSINLPDLASDPAQPKVEQIAQGERHSMAIAAASIAATYMQHDQMRELGKKYPGLGFETHHGAGNKTHEALIRTHGLTPIHREKFAPIKRLARELSGPDIT